MTKSIEDKIQKSLKISLIDAFLYSLMVGAGESYLPAFALSLGMGDIAAGILTSLPLVTGALVQLVTPKFSLKIKNPKLWIVLSAIFQALAFLPLVYISFIQQANFWILISVFTFYWASGFSISPYWNYWMSQMVPDKNKNQYFSIRAKVSQIGIMVGLIGGGLALHHKIEIGPFSSVFGVLFLSAFLCRIMSSYFLNQKLYLKEWNKHIDVKQLSLKKSFKFLVEKSDSKTFLFLLFPFYMSVFISAPFVNPFLITQLKLEYSYFMGAILALLIGKYTAAAILEKMNSRLSAYQIFFFGVFAVSPGPMFWGISQDYGFILLLQFLSGAAWACYEVGIQLILFKDIQLSEKISFVSFYNFFISLASICGTFIGALFIKTMGVSYENYVALFLLGGFLRVILSAPLLFKVKQVEDLAAEKSIQENNPIQNNSDMAA